jgi:uncharacterized protein
MRLARRSFDPELKRLFGKAGENIVRSGLLLRELLLELPDRSGLAQQLKTYEQDGDRITHDIIHRLAVASHRRSLLAASDGYALASALDDVLDNTEQTAAQLYLYGVEAPMEQAVEFADVLVGANEEMARALERLTNGGEPAPHLVEIHRLENEGDRLLRDSMASLFAGGADPMVVIRWKDVFESLEGAVDACETVAHVIEGVTLKRGWWR